MIPWHKNMVLSAVAKFLLPRLFVQMVLAIWQMVKVLRVFAIALNTMNIYAGIECLTHSKQYPEYLPRYHVFSSVTLGICGGTQYLLLCTTVLVTTRKLLTLDFGLNFFFGSTWTWYKINRTPAFDMASSVNIDYDTFCHLSTGDYTGCPTILFTLYFFAICGCKMTQ